MLTSEKKTFFKIFFEKLKMDKIKCPFLTWPEKVSEKENS